VRAFVNTDYATARNLFFQPTAEEPSRPVPVDQGGTARRLRDALEPLAEHAVWSPRTNDALTKLGLNFVTGYVWGRAAALGEPPADLVVAAFAVFEPRLLAAAYVEARRQCGRASLLAAREDATVESLTGILQGEDVTGTLKALRRGVEAADGIGRPLFSGLRSLGWPDDPLGQLWRACDLLREHRGDSHIAVSIAAGLGPVTMNLLTELWLGMPLGSYTASYRGWSEEAIAEAIVDLERRGLVIDAELTAAGRHLRDTVEESTDALERPVVDAMGDDFEAVVRSLDTWSGECVAAGAFPPDIFKRAAG
jgi:hypothetical protein